MESQKIKYISKFANDLICVDTSATVRKIESEMRANAISTMPIMNNAQKRNVGVVKLKTIFVWLMENPGKTVDDIDISEVQEEALKYVEMEDSLQSAMKKLQGNPAILLKNGDVFTKIITPRVIANALEEYSKRFMVYESLENKIRTVIDSKISDLTAIKDPETKKSFPPASKDLTFGQYETLFNVEWEKLELNADKKTVLSLIRACREYRNDLMHFKLSGNESDQLQAEKLSRLL